jgi:hypothetical protein
MEIVLIGDKMTSPNIDSASKPDLEFNLRHEECGYHFRIIARDRVREVMVNAQIEDEDMLNLYEGMGAVMAQRAEELRALSRDALTPELERVKKLSKRYNLALG